MDSIHGFKAVKLHSFFFKTFLQDFSSKLFLVQMKIALTNLKDIFKELLPVSQMSYHHSARMRG